MMQTIGGRAMMDAHPVDGRVATSVLDLDVAAANLSLYLQLTPMDQIEWRQVAAALDRLERLRTEVRGLRDAG